MATKMKVKVGSKSVTLQKRACGNKTDMKKKAASARKSGKYARVEKTERGYCVFTGGKRKVKASGTTKKRKSTKRKTTKRKTTAKRKTTRKPAKRRTKRRSTSSSGQDLFKI